MSPDVLPPRPVVAGTPAADSRPDSADHARLIDRGREADEGLGADRLGPHLGSRRAGGPVGSVGRRQAGRTRLIPTGRNRIPTAQKKIDLTNGPAPLGEPAR